LIEVITVGTWTIEASGIEVAPWVTETGLVRCEAQIIHVGGRTATAEGRVLDESGKLYAHATTTCMIFRP
jgi:acyl-coenzyme A thioesterase PaaI-like protein